MEFHPTERPRYSKKYEPITFWFRLTCACQNIWYGFMAPFDGVKYGGIFGYRLSPKLGFFFDLITGWTLPLIFASFCGGVGLILGGVACVGSFAEALRQFVAMEPYSMPISRILVDWIPKGS